MAGHAENHNGVKGVVSRDKRTGRFVRILAKRKAVKSESAPIKHLSDSESRELSDVFVELLTSR
ncbi:hypothetical protein E8F20_23830 [Pseudomonas sp. BN415]|uniref:hypothetical protein n=1 Tax=Pseudomonas sp. BN415 TaxID=2567889 RepID=UPI002457E054|nr:hypothetical protein [Pseudomonas sp. BN415]MDH4584897.1 hypothetical protein [Pseudomonas sp. BN415]